MSVISLHCFADNEKLYRSLDEAVVQTPVFVKQRENRIDNLKHCLQKATSNDERYKLLSQLFSEYRPYKSDSAAKYITEAINISKKMGNKSLECQNRAKLAYLCSSIGQYVEAIDILNSTDTVKVDNEALGQFYISLVHIYGELGYFTKISSLKQKYYTKQKELTAEMYKILSPVNDFYLQRKEVECQNNGDYVNALRYSDIRLGKAQPETHQYAIVAYYRHMDLKLAGKHEEAKEWLAKSAICDIHNAVMDQGSLWELAKLLAQEGDMERARAYINFAWECANTYSTHVRSWQISPILSNIDRQYQSKIEQTNDMLTAMTIVVSVLLVILILLLYNEYRCRVQLKEAHQELSEKNDLMKNLNEELLKTNRALDDTNRQLKDLVTQLNEQTRVKEVYVGRFMSLCSDYIDKIDDFRKRVNRMVKGREYEDLYRMTKSTDMKEQEIEYLYANFDNAFLHLFPNFIADFNALLRPEEQMVVAGEYKLNTTLRIFALIRLGIEDSSKIAKFLHYSVNTIYNYRARAKGIAITHRDDFEIRVKQIGM